MEIGTASSRLTWKNIMIKGLINGLIFIAIIFSFDKLLRGDIQALENYLLQGLFYGLFMAVFLTYLNQKSIKSIFSESEKAIAPELFPAENIEIKGPAGILYKRQDVEGKIFLTNRRLIFNPDKLNLQMAKVYIEYADIRDIVKIKSGRILRKILRIRTTHGYQFDFIVNERETWIEKLNEQILKYELKIKV